MHQVKAHIFLKVYTSIFFRWKLVAKIGLIKLIYSFSFDSPIRFRMQMMTYVVIFIFKTKHCLTTDTRTKISWQDRSKIRIA